MRQSLADGPCLLVGLVEVDAGVEAFLGVNALLQHLILFVDFLLPVSAQVEVGVKVVVFPHCHELVVHSGLQACGAHGSAALSGELEVGGRGEGSGFAGE